MSKTKVKEEVNDLVELEVIPERFKATIGSKKLFYTKSLPNQSQEPEIEGYTYYGCGDNGFYFVKS
jgi:hypothetical protein